MNLFIRKLFIISFMYNFETSPRSKTEVDFFLKNPKRILRRSADTFNDRCYYHYFFELDFV